MAAATVESANAPAADVLTRSVSSPLTLPTSWALIASTEAVAFPSKILDAAVIPVTVSSLVVMVAEVAGWVSV